MAAKTWCERVILCTFVRSASLFVGLLLGQASGAQGFAPSQNASMNVQGAVACVSLAAGQGSALSRPLRPSGACVETETAAQEGLASGGETATSAPSAGPSLPEPMAEPPGLLSASTAPSATSTSTQAGPGVSSCSLTSGSTAPVLGPQIAELLTAGLLPGASNEELEAALCPKFPDPCTFAEFEAIVGRRAYYVLTGRLRPLPAPLTLASAAARVRRQRARRSHSLSWAGWTCTSASSTRTACPWRPRCARRSGCRSPRAAQTPTTAVARTAAAAAARAPDVHGSDGQAAEALLEQAVVCCHFAA